MLAAKGCSRPVAFSGLATAGFSCSLGRMRRAINQTRGTVLCEQVEDATSAMARGRGLMGRAGLAPGAGMLIGSGPLPLMWIHTFFMRFPIDLVFLDRGGKIARIMPNVKPWRLTAPVFGARSALELEAGAAARNSSHAGDEVSFEELA
jgi:uncharacterized membrane protein (UPF0127 family)